MIKQYCEYLTFRSFYTGIENYHNLPRQTVSCEDELIEHTRLMLKGLNNTGILLSGGMDSAILSYLCPKGTIAYTVWFKRKILCRGPRNEIKTAREYVRGDMEHRLVEIKKEDYFSVINDLMRNKKMPLSPVEPMLYIAAKQAKEDGVENLVTGAAADTSLGGFKKLRGDYSVEEFRSKLEQKYHIPSRILKKTQSIDGVFENYLKAGKVNTKKFLEDIGVERFAYDNALGTAGCNHIKPFSTLSIEGEIDLEEESKYLIRGAYKKIYDRPAPEKLAMIKPNWLKNYKPKHSLFRDDINMNISFPKKFLLFCLEQYIRSMEA